MPRTPYANRALSPLNSCIPSRARLGHPMQRLLPADPHQRKPPGMICSGARGVLKAEGLINEHSAQLATDCSSGSAVPRNTAGAQEQPPHELPARDVDISYQITRPHQPRIIQRRRWFGERLVRIDGPDKSATIYDRNAHEITLLNLAKHTYLKLEGTPRLPLDPERGKALRRGNKSVVAGLHCVDWSWIEDAETHTVCLTSDGVLLRLVVDGSNLMQARSVSYPSSRRSYSKCRRAMSRRWRPEVVRGNEVALVARRRCARARMAPDGGEPDGILGCSDHRTGHIRGAAFARAGVDCHTRETPPQSILFRTLESCGPTRCVN